MCGVSGCKNQVLGSNLMKSNSIAHENKLKRWVSTRGGSYASTADPCVSCTTFNILAPIYKRLDKEVMDFPFQCFCCVSFFFALKL